MHVCDELVPLPAGGGVPQTDGPLLTARRHQAPVGGVRRVVHLEEPELECPDLAAGDGLDEPGGPAPWVGEEAQAAVG